MIITYRGKKNPLALNLPYLAKKYEFLPGVGVDVVDNDGRLLVGRFPQSFITDAALDEANIYSDIFTDSGLDGDTPFTIDSSGILTSSILDQAMKSAAGAINESVTFGQEIDQHDLNTRVIASSCGIVDRDIQHVDNDEDFTFETGDRGNVYLCPLCEKTYKVNSGRGKRVMVDHLEKDHAEEWLELQTRPDAVDQK